MYNSSKTFKNIAPYCQNGVLPAVLMIKLLIVVRSIMTNPPNEQTNLPILDSQLAFDMSSCLLGAFPTLTEKGSVIVFTGFLSFSII